MARMVKSCLVAVVEILAKEISGLENDDQEALEQKVA